VLEVSDVSHAYEPGAWAVREVSLRLEAGRIGCLLGPSGCGKTTLLRCIAGFETVAAGGVRLHGEVLAEPGRHMPPEKRRIGMVFQDYALLPHLSVTGNIEFGLHALPRAERRRRVEEMLELVGLAEHAGAYPQELSGGQQQRVALARSLAPRPRLLLMDEPFAHLDPALRERLLVEVKQILRQLGTTVLMVSHDPLEAFALADRLGVMREGRLEQWDDSYVLYHQPVNRFVAGFVGRGAWLKGIVRGDGGIDTELGVARGHSAESLRPGAQVDLLLRPDDVLHDDACATTARVVERSFKGSEFLYALALDSGARVLASVPSHHNHAPGERIGIRLATEHLVAFAAQV